MKLSKTQHAALTLAITEERDLYPSDVRTPTAARLIDLGFVDVVCWQVVQRRSPVLDLPTYGRYYADYRLRITDAGRRAVLTGAEQAAHRAADRLREIGWTAKVTTEDTEAKYHDSGEIRRNGRRMATLDASSPDEHHCIHGSWSSTTTGRASTSFLCGGTWGTWTGMTNTHSRRRFGSMISDAVAYAHHLWLREYLTAQGIEPTLDRMADPRLMREALTARAATQTKEG